MNLKDYFKQEKLSIKQLIVTLTIGFLFMIPYLSFILYVLSGIAETISTLDDTAKQSFSILFLTGIFSTIYCIVNITNIIVCKLGFYTPNDLRHSQKRLDKIKKSIGDSKNEL